MKSTIVKHEVDIPDEALKKLKEELQRPKRCGSWLPWQIKILQEHYNELTYEQIGRIVGKNDSTVGKMARKLGLSKISSSPGQNHANPSHQGPF